MIEVVQALLATESMTSTAKRKGYNASILLICDHFENALSLVNTVTVQDCRVRGEAVDMPTQMKSQDALKPIQNPDPHFPANILDIYGFSQPNPIWMDCQRLQDDAVNGNAIQRCPRGGTTEGEEPGAVFGVSNLLAAGQTDRTSTTLLESQLV